MKAILKAGNERVIAYGTCIQIMKAKEYAVCYSDQPLVPKLSLV